MLGEVALPAAAPAEVALAEVATGIAASQKAVMAAMNAIAREQVWGRAARPGVGRGVAVRVSGTCSVV